MEKPLLSIKNLHTYFETDEGVAKAVNGVDLSISKGQTFCLVGESGCGKSVTAQSIMRLIQSPPGRIVDGKILFEGLDLAALSDGDMRKIRGNEISMIFQEPMTSLNPIHRIGRQVAEVVQLHRGVSRREALTLAIEMLDQVGIPDSQRRVNDFPHQMSGGMRQRIMIAMALACNPKLIIADEPTTALDVTIQAQILRLMNRLKNNFNASILLITHDLGVVAQTAQQVAVMYAGRIVEQAPVNPLFEAPLHPYTQGLMAAIPKMDRPVPANRRLQTISGIVPSLFDLTPSCTFRTRCNFQFERCSEEPPLFEAGPERSVRCWLHE
jgi:peptide/nickel transport system ATP-binding protein/oligopeptide transport system ATP-binding protein